MKGKKRKGIYLLILCVMLTIGLIGTARISASPYERWDTVAQEEREAYESSEGLLRASTGSENAWKKINGVCYNGSGEIIPGAITRGIDVSEWQGVIDWKKV